MRFPQTLLLLALMLGFFLLCGCAGSPEQRLAGNWVVDANELSLPDVSALGAQGKQMADRIRRGLETATLKLGNDKKFTLVGVETISGDWSYAENKVTMKPSKSGVLSQLAGSESLSMTVDPDFRRMTLEFSTPFGPIRIGFRKTG
jgi:hypothetical protein